MKSLRKLCMPLFLSALCMILVPMAKCHAADFRYEGDTDGALVIVIDPGHGGENLGADYDGYLEKEMNLIVAEAMYEELSRYDGITVYMTRNADVDLDLQERADFAASVNADFLFCLHFNMSPNNNLFGSEVWIQLSGDENREGYRFGAVQMETMADMGLYIRGIKTRINDRGTDYYGILRHCKEYGITAALIEHCHVDHEKDR
ncbi:MAG: N-acetylmuramoyl-L-alanine amidase, partial [Lachnospiraceae bacterium]|nr:N-acetylmuramoyl-L-alanine amidase [Lachnospiraceae bacterium]